MNPTQIAKRILRIRRGLEWSQAKLGEAVGVSQATISRWESGEDHPEDVHLVKLAELGNVSLGELRYGEGAVNEDERVSVVANIGAGQAVYPIDDYAKGGAHESVPYPPGVDAGQRLLALKIEGDSMRPLRPGWLVYYRRDYHGIGDDCLNQLCVVGLTNGSVYVKEMRRGYTDGLFNLHSWTQGYDPLEDQDVEWASRVLAITPP